MSTEGRGPIPRVVHWLWLGTLPVPRVFEQYAERWRLHHPAWETRLWRDDTLPALSCQDALDRVKGFKRRYDIVRLEILRQFGGVIVDMDVEPIRPLDPLLQDVSAFVGRVGANHVGNQVLGATPGHPFFERAVEGLRASSEADGNSSQTSGKDFLRQLLAQHPEGVTVFPARTFYYEPSFDPPRRPDDFPDVYAVHHQLESYAASPQDGTPEQRFDQFLGVLASLLDAVGAGQAAGDRGAGSAEPGEIDRLRSRLAKAERRMRQAIAADAHRRRAEQRERLAELEQAEIRRAESERAWRGREH